MSDDFEHGRTDPDDAATADSDALTTAGEALPAVRTNDGLSEGAC